VIDICDDLESLKGENKKQAQLIAALQSSEKHLKDEVNRKKPANCIVGRSVCSQRRGKKIFG
jgi:hypothetical protein